MGCNNGGGGGNFSKVKRLLRKWSGLSLMFLFDPHFKRSRLHCFDICLTWYLWRIKIWWQYLVPTYRVYTAPRYHHTQIDLLTCRVCFVKGGPEPLEKEIHEILGSKREDRFSNPFLELSQNTCQVRFSYLLSYGNSCKGPQTLRKFLQKCQKIAGCWGRAVYVRKLWSPRHLAHPLRNDWV